MKQDKLNEALGLIKDEYIEEAHKPLSKRPWYKGAVPKAVIALASILICIAVVPSFFDRGYASNDTASSTEGYDYANNEYDYSGITDGAFNTGSDISSEISSDIMTDKKIIVTGNMDAETLNLDEFLINLNSMVAEYGGYFQSSSISNGNYRYYNATIRIPSDVYSEFINGVNNAGNVTYYNESSEDVTDTYYDTAARVENLKAEELRIQELYDQADNLADIMSIEERLTEIRYEIERYEAKLKSYDLLTSYSTLRLSVSETVSYTVNELSFGEKLISSFTDGFDSFVNNVEDIILFVTYNIFTIIFVIAAAVIVAVIYRRKRR